VKGTVTTCHRITKGRLQVARRLRVGQKLEHASPAYEITDAQWTDAVATIHSITFHTGVAGTPSKWARRP